MENEKKYKFVLSGLPSNTSLFKFPQNSLSHDELHGISVTQMHRGNRKNRVPFPLFRVQMPRQQNNHELLFQIFKKNGASGPAREISASKKPYTTVIIVKDISFGGSLLPPTKVC